MGDPPQCAEGLKHPLVVGVGILQPLTRVRGPPRARESAHVCVPVGRGTEEPGPHPLAPDLETV